MKKHTKPRPKNLYGIPQISKLSMVEHIRAGLPSKSIREVEKRLRISRARLAKALSIPERTLTRRLRQSRLTPIESDRLDRLIRIFTFAIDTLGSEETASNWMSKPNRALGYAIPLDRLATEREAREVEDVIGRIEWGLYS